MSVLLPEGVSHAPASTPNTEVVAVAWMKMGRLEGDIIYDII